MSLLSLLAAVSGGGPWLIAGVLLFGALTLLMIRLARTRGPVLIVDEEGIEDTRVGLRLAWNDVEAIRLRRRFVGLAPQTWLLLRVRDLGAVLERMPPGLGRRLGRLDRKLGVRTVFFVLNFLAVSPANLLAAIRRFYPGPVQD